MSGIEAEEQVRRRLSREEADGLVQEYESSGLTREVFCRLHGISVSVLDYHRRRRGGEKLAEVGRAEEAASSVALVAVDLVDRLPAASGYAGEAKLFVEVAGGRRIGVVAGFDGATLRHLIGELERV